MLAYQGLVRSLSVAVGPKAAPKKKWAHPSDMPSKSWSRYRWWNGFCAAHTGVAAVIGRASKSSEGSQARPPATPAG